MHPTCPQASWKEQIPDLDAFLGPAWYERDVWTPLGLDRGQHRALLRFCGVTYEATVWFNGVLVGSHVGGHQLADDSRFWDERTVLPSRVTVRVDGRLARTHVPPGGGWGVMAPGCYPNTSFDFYPHCGLQRSVSLMVRPRVGLEEALQLETVLFFLEHNPQAHGMPSCWSSMHVSQAVGRHFCALASVQKTNSYIVGTRGAPPLVSHAPFLAFGKPSHQHEASSQRVKP